MASYEPGAMPEKIGRYEIVRELGRGAMGIVYEGLDPVLGRRVAIKTARRDVMEASGMADEMMERFLREARAAGNLNHPNIITIHDAGEEAGLAYMAMEYLEGGDLSDVLRKKRRLSVEEVVDIGVALCEALAEAHRAGIVHRDIKPANILTPPKSEGGFGIKLADFGIAHMADSQLTQEGQLIGTPHYMSPEQFAGQHIDGRSDLFSVGAILYEMLTGEKPFGGEALSTVMHQVMKSDPIPPKDLNLYVSDALNQVILKAMAKRPDERYLDAACMAVVLRESQKAHPDSRVLEGGDCGEVDTVLLTEDLEATIPAGQLPSDTAWQSQETLRLHNSDPDGENSLNLAENDGGPPKTTRADKKAAAVVALVFFVFMAVLFSILLRGDDEEADMAELASTGDAIALENEGIDSDTPLYTRLRASVFVTTTQAVYDEYLDGLVEEADIQAHLVPPQHLDLTVALRLYGADGELVQDIADYASGQVLSLDSPQSSLEIEARHDGMAAYVPIFAGSATRPDQVLSVGSVILPPASDSTDSM